MDFLLNSLEYYKYLRNNKELELVKQLEEYNEHGIECIDYSNIDLVYNILKEDMNTIVHQHDHHEHHHHNHHQRPHHHLENKQNTTLP